ncbi:hypothetical protein G6F37_000993 [Rhizopus arrhizus]|nr:hypothetical protein G6F38_002598 [Rhizopus arrhizus]KAG1163682.1 hypothetical protein G6F37_000993 [Rhizopus arrhizus]
MYFTEQYNIDISPIMFDNYDQKDNNFRHSVVSTTTTATTASNSTQRLSVESSLEEDNIVTYYYALEDAICSDWMYKYETPSFSFSKTWKKRFYVLANNNVYVFKSTKSTNPAKEQFMLTEDTFVFVTEEFKKGYVIELRKPHFKWHIRCDSVEQMKLWLESMKKIVACIKAGYNGTFNPLVLSSLKLTEDYQLLDTRFSKQQSLPNSGNNNRKRVSSIKISRQSLAEIPDWETLIPPQSPPPRSRLPPIPLPTVSE